jgi:signal transduction histidine kinase
MGVSLIYRIKITCPRKSTSDRILLGRNPLERFHIGRDSKEKEKSLEPGRADEKANLVDLLIHDLTGPLSVVATSTAGLVERSDRYGPLTESQRRLLDRISRNVRKAQDLVKEIIEIFRSEEGLFEKEYFSVENTLLESLSDVLEMAIPNVVEKLCQGEDHEAFRHGLKEHGIFIEITGKYCKAPFCHDQKKIKQILRNLMSNAMKYRRDRMEVKISGEADLVVLVEDDGIGIPLKDQELIFKRFVRLNNEQRACVPGIGLGLTGVRTLVEAMGGEITFESREGVGTRFMVRIPAHSPSIS